MLFHNNDTRVKFNNALECMVLQYNNMSLLLPKKGWNSLDKSIIINGNFMANGMAMYWLAIDKAIHFWDTKKQVQTLQKNQYHGKQRLIYPRQETKEP